MIQAQSDIARTIASVKARQLEQLRSGLMDLVFVPGPRPDPYKHPEVSALNDIANSFSRFAAYQQTAFDNGAGSSSGKSANLMEQQVQQALNKVLGGHGSFMKALTSAFPTTMTS